MDNSTSVLPTTLTLGKRTIEERAEDPEAKRQKTEYVLLSRNIHL